MYGQTPGGHKRIGESEQDEADLIAEVEARTPEQPISGGLFGHETGDFPPEPAGEDAELVSEDFDDPDAPEIDATVEDWAVAERALGGSPGETEDGLDSVEEEVRRQAEDRAFDRREVGED